MPTLQDHSTQNTDGKLFARDLVHDLIPKLKSTENLVNNTLRFRAEKAGNDNERSHYQLLRQEFELEIMMIKMMSSLPPFMLMILMMKMLSSLLISMMMSDLNHQTVPIVR